MKNLLAPSIGNRFIVSLHHKFEIFPLDLAFQRISGIGRDVQVQGFHEGGDNVGTLFRPERVTHNNLVLERGVMLATQLTRRFDDVMRDFQCSYLTVVVILLTEQKLPVCSWTFTEALPVAWRTGDLDANSNEVLVNTLEFAYRDVTWIGVKG